MKPFSILRLRNPSSSGVNPTALSIYNKLAAGDWFTCEASASPLVGAHNSTSAAKIGAGATSAIPGKVGNSIDTTPDAIYRATTLPFTPASGSTYAMGIWVNPDAVNNFSPLTIGQSNNVNGFARALQMIVPATGTLIARAGNASTTFTDSTTAAGAVTTTAWHYLQAERGTSYVRCRVNNGSWVSTTIPANQSPTTSQAITVGGDYNSSTTTHQNQFNGKYDEAFFLNGTLTDLEWDYLYNSGSGISYAELKAAAGF
jgi:hypothetical protein